MVVVVGDVGIGGGSVLDVVVVVVGEMVIGTVIIGGNGGGLEVMEG